jgi:DNA-directed RNA polymerase specialized sigma24 family protein
MRRKPWRNGASWTPEEAAQELHRRRQELVGQLRRRSEARGVPAAAQEEIVDDAITAVVMSPRGVSNGHHLLGAFWLAVDHRCRRHREGRHFTRLGSRLRVEFDVAAQHAPASANPFDRLELRDRFARAADLMADLDAQERQVVSVMACNGVGPVSAARLLGLPLGEVRSAARSANAKLDQVAVISAAGRMCGYRYRAIAAHAAGKASASETTAARAHVDACVPCGRVYRKLRREMRGREFQRAAAAAFLPMPAVSLGHAGGLGKLAVSIEQRINFWPRGSGERTAEVLGGAGIAKAAAAGTAVVLAGSALTGHLVQDIAAASAPRHHRSARIERRAEQPVRLATPIESVAVSARASSLSGDPSRQRVTVHQSSPAPPSKSDGYLALGGSSGGSSPSGSSESSSPVRATAASVGQSGHTSSSEASPQPAQTGGGTSLGYLGK